jgi:hypothetical protein
MGLGAYQGLTPFSDDNVAGTVKNIKASGPGQLFALKLVNTTAAVAYLQLFALPAASVNLGTTVPYFFIRLNANESVMVAANEPINFNGSGISAAGTTTAGGNTGAQISVTALYLET